MNPDEMYVRERWDAEVAIEDHRLCCATSEWRLVIVDIWTHWNESPTAAWQAARAFTEQREEEIRQLEREIEWLEEGIDFDWFVDEVRQPADWSGKGIIDVARSTCTVARILARTQAALAELTRGMVGDGKGKR